MYNISCFFSLLKTGMKRKIIILFVSILFVFIYNSKAQEPDISYYKAPLGKDTLKNKSVDWLYNLSAGGNFALQLGSYTYIECSPHLAYHFNNWVSTGIGLNYSFYKVDLVSSHVIGGNAFAEAHFLKYLGVHVEYLLLNYENFYATSALDPKRMFSNNLLLGGGLYMKPIDKYAIYLMFLHNFSDRPEQNILYSPVVRVGFTVWLK